MKFEKGHHHLVESEISVVDLEAGLYVSQVNNVNPLPMVEKRIKGGAYRIGTSSTALIINGEPFLLHPYNSNIHLVESWENVSFFKNHY